MTLRVRLAALVAAMLVGAIVITGLAGVRQVENALVNEVDALVFARAGDRVPPPGGGAEPGDGVGLGPGAGPNPPPLNRETSDDADGRNVAQYVFDASGELARELSAGFDDDPLPALDLSRVPLVVNGTPTTYPAVDGELRYRVIVRETLGGGHHVFAGSLAGPDDTIATLKLALFVAGLIAAAAGAAIGYWVIRRETRPLDDLLEAADAFAGGALDTRAEVRRPGSEIGRLGVGLNAAFDRVEQSVRSEQGAKERLSAFVDDVAHELRTPATTIAGWTELYEEGALPDDESVDRMVDRIRGETARLSSLVDEMVLLARHDTIRPNLLGDVDLVELVTNAVDDANALDATRIVAVSAPESAVVPGDRTRLEQVLANLLDNARVHTPAGTPIDVRVRASASAVEVAVVDDGPGISAEMVTRVFDRSFRAATAGARGRGLGLAIVNAIVEAHGGSIEIESEVDRGTAVRVTLPSG